MAQVSSRSVEHRTNFGQSGEQAFKGESSSRRTSGVVKPGDKTIRRTVQNTVSKSSSAPRSNSQDSFVFPEDIEDPLEGCFSESD